MQRNMSWFGLIMCLLLLFVAFAVTALSISSSTKERQVEKERLESDTRQYSLDAGAIDKEIESIGTQTYTQLVARTEYDFVSPGEMAFEFDHPEELFRDSQEESYIRQQYAWMD